MVDEDEVPLWKNPASKADGTGPPKGMQDAAAPAQGAAGLQAPVSAAVVAADAAASIPEQGQGGPGVGKQQQAGNGHSTGSASIQLVGTQAAQLKAPVAATQEHPSGQPAANTAGDRGEGTAEEGKGIQRSTRGRAAASTAAAPARAQRTRAGAQRKPPQGVQATRGTASKRDRGGASSSESESQEDSSDEDEEEEGNDSGKEEEEEEVPERGRQRGRAAPPRKRPRQASEKQPAGRVQRAGRKGEQEKATLSRRGSKQQPAAEKGRRQAGKQQEEQAEQAGRTKSGAAQKAHADATGKGARGAAAGKQRRVVVGMQPSDESEEGKGSDKEEEEDQGPASPTGHPGGRQAAETTARHPETSTQGAPAGKGDAGRKRLRSEGGDEAGAADAQGQGRAADVVMSDADFQQLSVEQRTAAVQRALEQYDAKARELAAAGEAVGHLVNKWFKVPCIFAEAQAAKPTVTLLQHRTEPQLQEAAAQVALLFDTWKYMLRGKHVGVAEEHKDTVRASKEKAAAQAQPKQQLQRHGAGAGKSLTPPTARTADLGPLAAAKSTKAAGSEGHPAAGGGTPKKAHVKQEGRVTSPAKQGAPGAAVAKDVGAVAADGHVSANGTAAASTDSHHGIVTICGFQSRLDPERDAAVCLLTKCLTPPSQVLAQPLGVALQLEQLIHERCAPRHGPHGGSNKEASTKQYSDTMHALWGLLSDDEQQGQSSKGDAKTLSAQQPLSIDLRDLLLSGSLPHDKLVDELMSLAGRMHQQS